MKKTYLLIATLLACTLTQATRRIVCSDYVAEKIAAKTAQPVDFFHPYQTTHLRLPSVPLVVSDPYLSIWSPFDHLNDGTTRHWGDQEKPISGWLNVDGTDYLFMGVANDTKATQRSVSVTATSTYYTFACGPVELDVVFTAPMLIDDYDLLSSPANYLSFQVRTTDGQAHDCRVRIEASPLIAVNEASQPVVSRKEQHGGVEYASVGTIEQPILAKTGDFICIDWGYLYLPAFNGQVSIGHDQQLVWQHAFGTTRQAATFMLIGYDELWDIEYMYHRYKAYWAHDGQVSIFQHMRQLYEQYNSIMRRCRALDQTIYDDGIRAGNAHYAEILSASYRHVIAAHKLFRDHEGHLLFFSKENNSNGCVNTVDLTYPSAPLFLCYNPELQKAMMTSIFEYSRTGRWTKPFAAHDLGQYPKANGQVYGGDMPIEEAGNMLTLAATLCRMDGSTTYVEPYWDIITTWADYLSENGQDPAEQLCTDDFAGHWAHNANLSLKAIMGIVGYAEMAAMRGYTDKAERYMNRARQMASQWQRDALDPQGDHYRLAFDRDSTWSQKYNIVWDKLWQTNIFPDEVMQRELKYYLRQQNQYGLPLDCRREYTKSDWIMWTAAMAKDKKTFLQFVEPLYRYINETTSRVPISDWHETKTGQMVAFRARSVIGGYWMRVLMDKNQ